MKMPVYSKVWVMRDNHPTKMIVFAVIDSMDFAKSGIETEYRLVTGTYGVGWGNNEGERFDSESVFASREELLAHITKAANSQEP